MTLPKVHGTIERRQGGREGNEAEAEGGAIGNAIFIGD